jgi:uncharacterized membrane protein AbrB (regulator of aidB expression)
VTAFLWIGSSLILAGCICVAVRWNRGGRRTTLVVTGVLLAGAVSDFVYSVYVDTWPEMLAAAVLVLIGFAVYDWRGRRARGVSGRGGGR